VNEVRDELVGGDDELAEWARARGAEFFLKQDQSVAPSLAEVSRWINSHPDYTASAKYQFLGAADYPLVAYAHAHSHVVVTHERPEESRKRVKIPNVCLGLGVEYTNIFAVLRRERARFVLTKALPERDGAATPRSTSKGGCRPNIDSRIRNWVMLRVDWGAFSGRPAGAAWSCGHRPAPAAKGTKHAWSRSA
jgi:hypothetical protein